MADIELVIKIPRISPKTVIYKRKGLISLKVETE